MVLDPKVLSIDLPLYDPFYYSYQIDIVNLNRTLTLGFIWSLILTYQIKESDEGSTAKKDLIKWCRSIGLNINNLTEEYVSFIALNLWPFILLF